jgi:hypothetical protein
MVRAMTEADLDEIKKRAQRAQTADAERRPEDVLKLVAEIRRLRTRIANRHDTADGKTCGYCARPWPCPDRLEVGTCSPGRGNLSRPGPGCLLA